MNIFVFWAVIKRTQNDDQELQKNLLWEELMNLEKRELIKFNETFLILLNKLINSTLENGLLRRRLLEFGSHDDDFEFEDFAGWIISQGEELYREAIKDPEKFLIKSKSPFFEEICFMAIDVYQKKYNSDMLKEL